VDLVISGTPVERRGNSSALPLILAGYIASPVVIAHIFVAYFASNLSNDANKRDISKAALSSSNSLSSSSPSGGSQGGSASSSGSQGGNASSSGGTGAAISTCFINSQSFKPTYSFLSSWGGTVANSGWHHFQAIAAGFVTQPQVLTNHGLSTALVTVNPGDDPLNLEKGTERSEVVKMTDPVTHAEVNEDSTSGTQYFGLSYYFPSNWNASSQLDSTHSDWSIIWQLHGPNTYQFSPSFAIDAGKKSQTGVPQFYINLQSGFIDPKNKKSTMHHFPFNSPDNIVPLGHWVDFIIRINFSVTTSGSFTVWRRDEGKNCFHLALDKTNIPTLQQTVGESTVPQHYWKQGLYRRGQLWTDQLLLGPMSRAPSFADAEMAAFGTNSTGAPITP
jgi:YHS domain-containing protein